MKRSALVAVAVIALASHAATAISESPSPQSTQPRCPTWTGVEAFNVWAGRVWNQARWQRGRPPDATIAAERRRIACAPNSKARHAMQRFWRSVEVDFFAARRVRLWRARVKPYVYPDGRHWAAPYPIAWCESGGDYNASSAGAYGEVPPYPQNQPPKVQDEIAHRLMEEGKEYSAWVEWEGGCAYR